MLMRINLQNIYQDREWVLVEIKLGLVLVIIRLGLVFIGVKLRLDFGFLRETYK